VNEPSEYVSAPNTVEGDDGPRRRFFDWRALAEGAVGAMLVVVTDVDRKDPFEVSAVHDKEPVEALAADGADPPFDERVRAGCPHGCADRPDALGAEHLVERRRELAVAVMDQEPDRLHAVDERLDDVACLLCRPLAGRVAVMLARYTCRVASSMNTSAYSRRNRTVSTVKKSQATIPLACARKNCCQVSDERRGAGSMPDRCRIDQTVLAAIRIPSPASSPYIRR
jgi:hypothetical protein